MPELPNRFAILSDLDNDALHDVYQRTRRFGFLSTLG